MPNGINSFFNSVTHSNNRDKTFDILRSYFATNVFTELSDDEKFQSALKMVKSFKIAERPKAIKFFIAQDAFTTLKASIDGQIVGKQTDFILQSFEILESLDQPDAIDYIVSSKYFGSLEANEKADLCSRLLNITDEINLYDIYQQISTLNFNEDIQKQLSTEYSQIAQYFSEGKKSLNSRKDCILNESKYTDEIAAGNIEYIMNSPEEKYKDFYKVQTENYYLEAQLEESIIARMAADAPDPKP